MVEESERAVYYCANEQFDDDRNDDQGSRSKTSQL